MKKVVRLTESDLMRIVKRVLKEDEMVSNKDMSGCKSKVEVGVAYKNSTSACKSLGIDGVENCVLVGGKSMYPKTYQKLKSNGISGYPIGCVELDGESLVFYEHYSGILNLFGKWCGDELIRIPKVGSSVKNWSPLKKGLWCSWVLIGDKIYVTLTEGLGC